MSATVGTFPYSSSTITLNVRAAVTSNDFRLNRKGRRSSESSPGQLVNFQYQIFFNGSMQLLREDLPLLNVQGFVALGSPTITTETSGQGSVQTITQAARATAPGTTETGPSLIEGMSVDASSGTPDFFHHYIGRKRPLLVS